MIEKEKITLAHGNGGIQMRKLLHEKVFDVLDNPLLREEEDGAVLDAEGKGELVFSTDSFVVQPLFFPGGDIGHLAVCGTVNDIAMMGGVPEALSLAFIIESGFSIEILEKIVKSIKKTADEAGVKIVTGDTKVVEKGQADKIYINTSGIGWKNKNVPTGWRTVQEGDVVIVSGTIGHHGVAVLAARNELPFVTELKSDAMPVNKTVEKLLEKVPEIRWFRDPTRGGLAAALNELAEQTNFEIELDEEKIPVAEDVRGAAEILGLDPLYLANEGRFVVVCPPEKSDLVLEIIKKENPKNFPAQIGTIKTADSNGRVVLSTKYGSSRIIDMPSGEQLPRIC